VHNSFARANPFELDQSQPDAQDDDVFHFVAYMPIKGKLYELDGLQAGPIPHGDCTDENWIDVGKCKLAFIPSPAYYSTTYRILCFQ
jgi:hypothetical protein